MKHILNTIFLEETINCIDEKYKNIVVSDFEKYFTYSSIFKFPLYYNFHTYKKNPDYGLYDKFYGMKNYDVIDYLIKQIRENNYCSNYILILYSYISNITLSYYLDKYQEAKTKTNKFLPKKKKMFKYSRIGQYIESQFYKERYYKSINELKINVKNIKLDEECFGILNNLCKDIYYNSYGVDIFKIGYKNFIKYQHRNYHGVRFLNKAVDYILDSLTRSKKISSYSIYNISQTPKVDYLNKENKLWISGGNENYKSVNEIYQEALAAAINLINIVSSDIFYNTNSKDLIIRALNKIKSRF